MSTAASPRLDTSAVIALTPNEHRDFTIEVTDAIEGDIERIALSREEFSALRSHLALLRGSTETSSPAAKGDERLAATPPSSSLKVIVNSAKTSIRIIQRQASSSKVHWKRQPHSIPVAVADSLLLVEIMRDWESGAFDSHFAGETPLLAAIRGNLEL